MHYIVFKAAHYALMMLICQDRILTTRPAYYGQDVLTDRPENILRIGPQDLAFFVDECGHEEFADGDYPVFGLGGCAAMGTNIELTIRISRTTMKSECFGDENVPLHASDLFDRFTQADATDTRQKGGTDLGLNISLVIVETHGGAIGADSVPWSTSKKTRDWLLRLFSFRMIWFSIFSNIFRRWE